MDYSNLHSHHQLQSQVINAPNSSLPTTFPRLSTTSATANKYCNSTNIILNSTSTGNDVYNHHDQQLINEAIPNSRAPWSPHDHHHQDFVSYRGDITRSFMTQLQYSPNQETLLPLSNIKEEISDSFSKMSERTISNLTNPSCDAVDHIWLNNCSISSGSQKFSAGDQAPYSNNTTIIGTTFEGFTGVAELNLRYDWSDNFPMSTTTNYKAVSDSLCSSSSSLGFSFHGLDLLSSTSSQSSSHVNLGLYDRSRSLGLGDHHDVQDQSKDSPSSNSSNITSALKNEVSRTKRPNGSSGNFSEPKASQSATKKSRSSNPPLKIRKEKLGDRIAALHRLVAPFGKTDTASVLTEAIGYIQFLHDQVQTLSVPYMKSLQSKPSRKMQQGLSKVEEKETKQELRSRGLCLVPISCVSYISGYD